MEACPWKRERRIERIQPQCITITEEELKSKNEWDRRQEAQDTGNTLFVTCYLTYQNFFDWSLRNACLLATAVHEVDGCKNLKALVPIRSFLNPRISVKYLFPATTVPSNFDTNIGSGALIMACVRKHGLQSNTDTLWRQWVCERVRDSESGRGEEGW